MDVFTLVYRTVVRMRCDIRVSSFAPVVVFQLAPQCYVTARFEISPRGAGREDSLTIVPYKCSCERSLVGFVCIGSTMLTFPRGVW